ncbi:MAG: sulfatase [Acidobacteriota bacterium]
MARGFEVIGPRRPVHRSAWLQAVDAAVVVGLLGGVCAHGAETLPARPSILLISIDTLRADHLGVYGYPRPTDEQLRARLGDFDTYDNAYTTLPLTLPSHAALMTGLYPRNLGVLNNHHALPASAPPTLAGLLADEGYRTAAVVGSAVLSSSTGISRGFGVYDEPALHGGATRRSADDVTERAMSILESAPGPLFLFVHYYDVHPPYFAPDQNRCLLRAGDTLRRILSRRGLDGVAYQEVLNRKHDEPIVENGRVVTIEEMIVRYDASLLHVTERISRLLDLWNATSHGAGGMVIITSDHGEGLGQHGYWSHGMTLYDEVLRVPLMIRWPGEGRRGKSPRRIERAVSLVDIVPTILDVLHLHSSRGLAGRSIRDAQERRGVPFGPVVAQRMRYMNQRPSAGQRDWRKGDGYAILDGPYKYLEGEGSAPALFDRSRDPFELHNLVVRRVRIARRLHSELEEWLTHSPEGRPVLADGESDEQRRRRLRSLGYVD